MKNKKIKKTVYSAMLLAVAYVLPFITGQIPQIGKMLCPMHLPVILCGFFCGMPYGLAVGIIAPLLRSLTLGVPYLFPNALCMCIELGSYGFFAGLFYGIFPKKKGYIYISLLLSMLCGRILWGISRFLCTGLNASKFGISAFIAGGITEALPGIALQIILIPLLVMLYEKLAKSN